MGEELRQEGDNQTDVDGLIALLILLVTFYSRSIGDRLASWLHQYLIANTQSTDLRRSLLSRVADLRRQQAGISQVAQFAKYSRLQRDIDASLALIDRQGLS